MKYNLGESDNRISIALTRDQWISLLCGEFVDPDNCGLSETWIALIKKVEADRKQARQKIREAIGA